MSVYIKRTERSQINDLMLHITLIEKQEIKNKQKERNNKNKGEINKIETKTPTKESNKNLVPGNYKD
jgi:hypothetical protein